MQLTGEERIKSMYFLSPVFQRERKRKRKEREERATFGRNQAFKLRIMYNLISRLAF